MKFFLDFEAMRFTNKIISIGCVAENGNTFGSLVKPNDKKKVDKFITELTGITNDMLADAPDADVAFANLFKFIADNARGTVPEYYVYGNCDADFLKATVKGMRNPLSITCAQAIAGNLIDYASVVKKFFVVKSDLALRKVYMLIQDEQNLVQKHNALEDAQMLEVVVSHLYDKCKPEDKDTILAMPSQAKPKMKKAPAQFLAWDNVPKWEADTNGTEDKWAFKCVDQHSGDVKYFDNAETAALWVVKYIARNVSPKNTGAVSKIQSAIKQAPQSGKCRYNCYWEYNPEGAIATITKEEN